MLMPVTQSQVCGTVCRGNITTSELYSIFVSFHGLATVGIILATAAVFARQPSLFDISAWSSPPRYVSNPPTPPAENGPILDELNLRAPISSSSSSSSSPSATTPIHCFAPATGQLLGHVTPATCAFIDQALSAAVHAQHKWARTSFRARRAVLRTLLRHILDQQADIVRTACLDSGKTAADAVLGEILVTVEKITWLLRHGERALAPSQRPTNLLMCYKRNRVIYEPLGVVAALVSWNYPFHNFMGPVVAALFAGNAIVVKASEQTAWSTAYWERIVRGALACHGHDEALVHGIVCWPETAGHLTRHELVKHITFIGSRSVGKLVAADAAQSLTPIVMELGGKDAAVVLDSAVLRRESDAQRVVEILLRGTFQAAGQNCIGIERVVASRRACTELERLLVPRVRALRMGTDCDVGAMVVTTSSPCPSAAAPSCATNNHLIRLEALIQDAVDRGARLLCGGSRYAHPKWPYGTYFAPTLLADVTRDMPIAKTECFAPIMLLMPVADHDEHDQNVLATTTGPGFGVQPLSGDTGSSSIEATAARILHIVNHPPFDLGASIFGAPTDPLIAPLTRGVRSGMVSIDDFAAYYAVQLPFGGVDGSGFGRFGGEEGLRGLCNVKAVCEDRTDWWWRWLGLRTAIPPRLQYPIADQLQASEFMLGVVEMAYEDSMVGRVKGLMRVLRNM